MTDEQAGQEKLLIVDDDQVFRGQLVRTMSRRGFETAEAESFEQALAVASTFKPEFAVVDMRLGDGNGLDLVGQLHDMMPDLKIVMLTGYGNLASAVAAIKSGAINYLAKPASPEEIENALRAAENEIPAPPENPMSVDRVRWEHIQRVYESCNRNVSETARRLNMHRRTLQRILAKRSPR